MKSLVFVLSLVASAICLAQEEGPQTWTDLKGRTLTGTLVAKNRKTVDIKLSPGKSVTFDIAKLSKDDQRYVEDAVVHPTPEVQVSKVKAGEKALYSIEVTVTQIYNRTVTIEVVWIEEGEDKRDAAHGHRETRRTTVDGTFHFETTMKRKYLGFEVVLRNVTGEIVARQASSRMYERFVDNPNRYDVSIQLDEVSLVHYLAFHADPIDAAFCGFIGFEVDAVHAERDMVDLDHASGDGVGGGVGFVRAFREFEDLDLDLVRRCRLARTIERPCVAVHVIQREISHAGIGPPAVEGFATGVHAPHGGILRACRTEADLSHGRVEAPLAVSADFAVVVAGVLDVAPHAAFDVPHGG